MRPCFTGGAKSPGAQAIARGEPGVAVGTQALIQEASSFQSLALAVIDEQHRFGVQDRLKLIRKGRSPHVLLMSATPIPRTLALAVHGDLDLSILDELPPGRTPVTTELLTGKAQARAVVALEEEMAHGRQSAWARDALPCWVQVGRYALSHNLESHMPSPPRVDPSLCPPARRRGRAGRDSGRARGDRLLLGGTGDDPELGWLPRQHAQPPQAHNLSPRSAYRQCNHTNN